MAGPEIQQSATLGANVAVGAELQQQLTQAQLQSLHILQIPTSDLERELEAEVEKNPLLEMLPPESREMREAEVAREEDSWRMDSDGAGNKVSAQEAQRRRDYFFNSIPAKESVYESLERQIELAAVDEETRALLKEIYFHLDRRGFLDMPAEKLCESLNVPQKKFAKALEIFRSFEPPGVGSENLRDFYLFHLNSAGYAADAPEQRLVREGFDDLLAGKVTPLAEKLGLSRERLDEAIATIAAFPRAAIEENDPTIFVEPDLIFYKDERTGQWSVRLAREQMPRLQIAREYKSLLAQGKITGKDKVYFEQKWREAQQVIAALEERGNTLEAIGRLIVELQRDFFEKGPTALRPVIMADLAKRLSVHPTTVTRAVAHKYAKTPFGIWELRSFFSNESGQSAAGNAGSNLSQVAVKNMLKKLIEGEARGNPYSDETLVRLLEEQGVKIARRTVVKYREALGIPSTRVRRNL
ncbi:MAG: RNA polymerase factor sigma-54 [Opitutales bacterium]|nr:RNA polymerase factor sigma-54 [Opitutales bacterium]